VDLNALGSCLVRTTKQHLGGLSTFLSLCKLEETVVAATRGGLFVLYGNLGLEQSYQLDLLG
jgi:hypothetical protein